MVKLDKSPSELFFFQHSYFLSPLATQGNWFESSKEAWSAFLCVDKHHTYHPLCPQIQTKCPHHHSPQSGEDFLIVFVYCSSHATCPWIFHLVSCTDLMAAVESRLGTCCECRSEDFHRTQCIVVSRL
jgi:hypothetical protein